MAPPKHFFIRKWMTDLAAAKELPSSMCFQVAWAVRHYARITGEEYYHHVFAHLTGTSHEADEKDDQVRELKSDGPFAYVVLDCAKKIGPIQDAEPFEQAFHAYDVEDLEQIESIVSHMEEGQVPWVLRMLAIQALLDRQPDVLKFCLDRGGFEYDENFVHQADILNKNKYPEIFKALEGSEFRRLHPCTQHPAFATDIGGEYPVDW